MALAFERRKDLLSLQAQLEVADRTRKAVRSERLPALAFDGYYGVLGETLRAVSLVCFRLLAS